MNNIKPNSLKKRSVRIAKHETSITLEEPFWLALQDIAAQKDLSISQLITEIDKSCDGNLSSALRLYILQDLQDKLAQQPI